MRAANGPAASGNKILQMRKVHCKFDAPKTKTASRRIAPTIACVVETGIRSRVANKIHDAAPTRAARTNEKPGVVWRRLCGVKTENSLPEIRIADKLPMPEKKPPHARALLLGLKPEVIGSRMSDMMLFPASLAPLPKARKNRIASPSSVSIDNSHLEISLRELIVVEPLGPGTSMC